MDADERRLHDARAELERYGALVARCQSQGAAREVARLRKELGAS